MATIYRCDRCGDEYNNHHDYLNKITYSQLAYVAGPRDTVEIEICNNCFITFKEFLDKKNR